MSEYTKSYPVQIKSSIAFKNLIDFLFNARIYLATGLLLGIVGGLFYIRSLPKQYEAHAILQVAKVLGNDLVGRHELVQRLKSPTYYQDDQIEACGVKTLGDHSDGGAFLASRVYTSILNDTNFILLKYKAYNPDAAKQCLNAVVENIVSEQTRQADLVLAPAKDLLSMTKEVLEEEKGVKRLLDNRLNEIASAKYSVESSLLLIASSSKKQNIGLLLQSAFDQTKTLESPMTRPARLVDPIYLSEVTPKTVSILSGAMMGGLFLGALAFLVRRSWLR